MEAKEYTEKNYVPLSELEKINKTLFNKVQTYRQKFIEIIKINDLFFASLVETPNLIKKRFKKNIEIKDLINIELKGLDYILEIAKLIVQDKEIEGLNIKQITKIKKLFHSNNNDLTIITNYLVNSFDDILIHDRNLDISKIIPELNKYELMFIKNNNKNNLNYSIQDFLNTTNSSYETARKGLDKLFNLQLFNKNKVGKKFVFKPTRKLSLLIKEGQYGY